MKRSFLLPLSALSLLASGITFAIIDTNENTLSDLWEKQYNNGELYPSTFDPEADPDQDGWTNAEEAAAGTDPENPNPPNGLVRPDILHNPAVMGEENGQPVIITPEAVTVSWPTLIGKQYTLYFSPDLAEESWLTIDQPFIGDGDIHEFHFLIAGAADKRIWRVAVQDTDTDGDTLTNAEEHELGTNPDSSDTDGDGKTDDEEVEDGTEPNNPDTDNDTLADGIDADPNEALVDWERASEAQFLLIDIDVPAGQLPRDLNDKGEVLFDEGIFADGQWIPMERDDPISGTYAREAGDEGTNDYESTLEYWNTFNENRQLTGISGCLSSFTPDPESELGGGDRFLYSFLSWLQPQPQYCEEMTAQLTGSWRWPNSLTPLGIAADGKMASIISYMEDVDPSPETEELEERTRLVIFPPDNGAPVVISPPDDYLLTTNSYTDTKVNSSGWITSQSRKTVRPDPESDPEILHRVHLWKPDHTPVALPTGTMASYQFRLNITELPNGRVVLTGVSGEQADGTVLLESPANTMSHCESLSAHGIQFFSGNGTAITRLKAFERHGSSVSEHHLWRNGELTPLGDLCKRYQELIDEGWSLHPLKANDKGAYLLIGEGPQSQIETKLLLPVEVAVDADRDGEITFDQKDKTTAEKPFRFWINDDRDIGHTVDRIAHPPGDWEEDDVNSDEQANPDCDVPGLKFRRDLEDLTRIWIDFAGISSVFPASDSTVALKVRIDADSGTPKVNLFQPVESDGGREFLKDEATGYNQLQGIYGQELCKVTGSSSVEVPRRAWETLPSDKVVHLLFEGAKEGDGKLIFVLWKDGAKVCDLPPVILRLRKANDFYETWTVGDVTSPEITDDNNNYSVWPASSASMQPNTGRDLTTPEKPEEKDYIMFVHGWNMTPDDKTQFADTMFKRLWHQGFKGRFGAYRWPTFFTPSVEVNNFNGSEERAWSSAAPLASLLQNRSTIFNVGGSSRVRVFGHSMGNIVCSEALRTLWPTAPVHTYVSGQAALAAHCWDEANPRWMPYGAHWSNTANIYRGYWQSSAGGDAPHKWEADSRPPYMHSSYMPSGVKYVNHHNIDDWALNSWELNQKLKPAIGYHYRWVPGSALGSEHRFYKNLVSPTTLLCPGDRFQIFSWASEARSFATGAEPLTDGVFSVFVDLKTDFGFDSMHKGHSAQFRSTVQKRWSYWTRFLNDNSITPITP